MEFPGDLKYTRTHEWVKIDGNKARLGITDYAQKEISDVVFVELPGLGNSFQQAKPAAVVESVKAAFDIYAPLSGNVTQANSNLESQPELVNKDCYGDGWFFELEFSDTGEIDNLLSPEEYSQIIKQEAK